MFSRRERIPGRDFPGARARRMVKSAVFVVKEYDNGLDFPHFAVVVGNKTDKRATRRHLLRRRAAVALRAASLPPGDFVILILPAANELSAKDFKKELQSALLKLS